MAISLSKNGNAIVFTFDDNDHYLGNGEISVPVNSLTLVTDESDMFTFYKAASNDIFISGLYSQIGKSKSELIAWYKENMVGSTGGGGVTSGEVQTMIDESISGKADISDVATVSGDVSLLSVQVETDEKVTANALVDLDNRKLDASAYTPTDLSNYYTKSQTNTQINNATGGLLDAGEFYEYTASTEARLDEDEEVTSAALNELNEALDDKADTTAVTESINAAVSGKADTSAVTASITAAVSGKQDTLVSGTNIKTINNESLLGSGNIDIQGGGKAIEAGRGIAITTGATADTVSFNLPIWTNQYNNSVAEGDSRNNASFYFSHAEGNSTEAHYGAHSEGTNTKALGYYSHAEGQSATASGQSSHAEGISTITNNDGEHASGMHNVSHTGSTDADKTLFSVGNGTAENARHNAFEIRQNGDIYITKDGSDVKLQDQLGGGGLPESAFTAYTASTEARLAEDEEVTAAALNTLSTALGGFKLVSLTQAQYDALTTKDASTLYIITNVVN